MDRLEEARGGRWLWEVLSFWDLPYKMFLGRFYINLNISMYSWGSLVNCHALGANWMERGSVKQRLRVSALCAWVLAAECLEANMPEKPIWTSRTVTMDHVLLLGRVKASVCGFSKPPSDAWHAWASALFLPHNSEAIHSFNVLSMDRECIKRGAH